MKSGFRGLSCLLFCLCYLDTLSNSVLKTQGYGLKFRANFRRVFQKQKTTEALLMQNWNTIGILSIRQAPFGSQLMNEYNPLDDLDDEFDEIITLAACEEYHRFMLYLSKEPCRSSELCGLEYLWKFCMVIWNCIGTIDGIHIAAHVLVKEQIPYRGRSDNLLKT